MRVVGEYAMMRGIRRIYTLGEITVIGLMIGLTTRGIKRICTLGGLMILQVISARGIAKLVALSTGGMAHLRELQARGLRARAGGVG